MRSETALLFTVTKSSIVYTQTVHYSFSIFRSLRFALIRKSVFKSEKPYTHLMTSNTDRSQYFDQTGHGKNE